MRYINLSWRRVTFPAHAKAVDAATPVVIPSIPGCYSDFGEQVRKQNAGILLVREQLLYDMKTVPIADGLHVAAGNPAGICLMQGLLTLPFLVSAKKILTVIQCRVGIPQKHGP
jgi:hypothetical protein